jgi:hypothetical protein
MLDEVVVDRDDLHVVLERHRSILRCGTVRSII